MLTKRTAIFASLVSLMIAAFLFRNPLAWPRVGAYQERANVSRESLRGLRQRVTVVKDTSGVSHVTASSDHDAYFMMGYLHADDRLFQMDTNRRQGSGTLAEIFGAGPGDRNLVGDITLRAFGLRRSAERSLSAYSPEALALIQAYSDGVNAWLDSNPLPPEYGPLEITRVQSWSPVDSLTILKANSLLLAIESIKGDISRTGVLLKYQSEGKARGFDGTKLYFEDILRVAPFEPVVTVPRPEGVAPLSSKQAQSTTIQSQLLENARRAQEAITPDLLGAAQRLLDVYDQIPLFSQAELGFGSNWWVVAGSKTDTGNAMLANDPHLGLGLPPIFYEIHLKVDADSSPMNVYGASIPGVPGVILGQNERISWGSTAASLDVADYYTESLVFENGVPTATRYKDRIEPLVFIPEEFKVNQIQNGTADDVVSVSPGRRPSGLDVPPATLIVPRRNNGNLVLTGSSQGLSLQYTGTSASRELEGIFALARARNLADFKQGLEFLDGGSQNWAYADVDGNIAAFVSGKVPLREDLQAGSIDGLPPFFLRNGSGTARNEWIPRSDGDQGGNYETLPFEEMPQVVNPAQGFLVNANNDPLGIMLDNNPVNQMRPEGIYYISDEFDPGFRAAKITNLLKEQFSKRHGNGKVSFGDMKRIQSNVQMLDAEVFTPYIIRAFNAARGTGAPADLAALANDPAVSAAIERLSKWDFSTPTGIPQGYDASDLNGTRLPPSIDEVSNSIAATIYTVWRNQVAVNTIVATLQRVGLTIAQISSPRMLADLKFLLDNFATNHGVGSSGLDFFEIPGVNAPAEIRRDAIILKSLKEALDLLAGEPFAAAFGRSTNQDDYRWGNLHRVSFRHMLGGQFNIPSPGNFENLSPTLPGLATDGGFETIDSSTHGILFGSSQSYVFGFGPARRYVSELRPRGIKSVQVIPGGESGIAGNPFYSSQLSLWLTNDYHRVLFTNNEINSKRFSKVVYNPGN